MKIIAQPAYGVFTIQALEKSAKVPNKARLERVNKAAAEVEQMMTDNWRMQMVFDGQTGKQLVGAYRLKGGKTSSLLDFDGRPYDSRSPESYSIALSKIDEFMSQ